MKPWICFFTFVFCMAGAAQAQKSQTLYFSSEGKVGPKNGARFYSTVTQDKKDTAVYWVETFQSMGGRIASSGTYRARKFPVAWERLHEPTFRDALKEGLYKEYHQNGQLKFQGAYKNGRDEGKHTRWYESGRLLSEGTMAGGLAEGTVTVYHEGGQKKSQSTAKGGLREGEMMEYYEDGKKKSRTTFKSGKKVGEVILFDAQEKEIPRRN